MTRGWSENNTNASNLWAAPPNRGRNWVRAVADGTENEDQTGSTGEVTWTRREALAAMAKYSAVVGGSAAIIVTADGLVSATTAYPPWLGNDCRRHPNHWICTWDGRDRWGTYGRGDRGGRIHFKTGAAPQTCAFHTPSCRCPRQHPGPRCGARWKTRIGSARVQS